MNTSLILPVLLAVAWVFPAMGSAQQPTVTDPNFIASPADLKARISEQLHITKPD
jgi:hypothetical protein